MLIILRFYPHFIENLKVFGGKCINCVRLNFTLNYYLLFIYTTFFLQRIIMRPNITVNLDPRCIEPGVFRFFRNSLYVAEGAAFLQLIRIRKSKIEYSHSI